MHVERAWALVENAARAVLATIGPDGSPRLVPVVFGVTPDLRVVTSVDHKPKTTRRLARLADIERDHRVALLVDHYEDDWNRLWWVRIEGHAVVATTVDSETSAILVARYRQYHHRPPSGPWIIVSPFRVSGWEAEPGQEAGSSSRV